MRQNNRPEKYLLDPPVVGRWLTVPVAFIYDTPGWRGLCEDRYESAYDRRKNGTYYTYWRWLKRTISYTDPHWTGSDISRKECCVCAERGPCPPEREISIEPVE